ncbi:MAG: hypothetical protein CO103_04960, partial [Chloroflexi bacterium CG_4_9_14_3_um_filter_45_9]
TGEVEETDFKIDTEIGYEAAQYLWSEYVSGFMDEGREDPPPEWPFIFRRDMFEGRVDTYLERLYDLWSPMTCAHPVLKTIMLD